jgi:hypothetical protein
MCSLVSRLLPYFDFPSVFHQTRQRSTPLVGDPTESQMFLEATHRLETRFGERSSRSLMR